MSEYRFRFDDAEWEYPRTGLRTKTVQMDPGRMRLLELAPELCHPEWCTVGHVGYILEGVLEVRFADEVLVYEPGDGIVIPGGEAHKHIPRALTEVVRMFIVDEV